MKLHELLPIKEKSKKRLGRGTGSGKGNHTVGRGTKGQRSRVGKPIPLWFEGGQLPLIKRLPFLRGKSRFNSLKRKPQLVSLALLVKLNVLEVSPKTLKEHNLVKDALAPIKIVGKADVTKAMTVEGVRMSQSAKAQIEKAGGKIR